jgi:glycerol dehydrogenase-like iron-containing ADH family enzyme
LIGGDSGAYHFDGKAASKLAVELDKLAEKMLASVLVTTSARTTQMAAKVLKQSIKAPHYFFQWSPDQQRNPYYAYLAVADAFVVTGESVSMITEACVIGKPVYLYDFGLGQDSMRHGGDVGKGVLAALALHVGKARWKIALHKLAMRFGASRMRRNIAAIHRYYIETGQAVWLGEPFSIDRKLQAQRGVECVVERVKQLLESQLR